MTWRALRIWAGSTVAKRGCPGQKIVAQLSKASFGTRKDKSNRQTKSVLSMSAAKIEGTIRLAIQSSNADFFMAHPTFRCCGLINAMYTTKDRPEAVALIRERPLVHYQ
jgi:hypothetical protein